MPVIQANSLSQVYASVPQTEVTRTSGEGGKFGGMSVRQDEGGVPRAYATKTKWERFTSRLKHGFESLTAKSDSDTGATQMATRFNARHEGFSSKVENLVARLASGTNADVSDPDVLATLRNDVKVMHRNAPWASRTDLLSTRLDVELSKLTPEQLETVATQLSTADTSKLTDKDKVDLQTIQRAVVRHQLSRSDEMTTLLGTLNHASPGNVTQKATLLNRLDTMSVGVQLKLGELHLPEIGKNEDILSGAVTLALRRAGHHTTDLGRKVLGGMNRNLRNIEHQVRVDGKNSKGDLPELARRNPLLRMLGRAVREEFLQTEVTSFKDENLRSRMKPIGSGAAHTVSKGEYEHGMVSVSRVHKYDDEELVHPSGNRFAAPGKLGIDQSNPCLLERAVFTAKLDKKLDFNVSVGTDFARHHDQTGIVMELAGGRIAHDVLGATGSTAVVQRDLIKLQLLDIISGQADRHGGNYLVEQNGNGEIVGIKAIDSDFCMGPEPDDVAKILGHRGVHLPGLPPVVDEVMAQAIRGLSNDDLRDLCGDFFDDATLTAAQGRLAKLKEHINKLEIEDRVIDPGAWGSQEVTTLLTTTRATVLDSENLPKQIPTSYFQRDYRSMQRLPVEVAMTF